MSSQYINQKYSFLKVSETNVTKNLFHNPWLNFFRKNKIQYRMLSLRQNDIITFDSNYNLYNVLLGSLIIKKVFQDTSKISLNILTHGDTFGYGEITSNELYYEVEAINTTHLICVEYTKIINACCNYPKFNIFFFNHVVRSSTKAYYFTEIVSHKSVTNRLVSLLLLLSEQSGIEYRNGVLLNFTVTHKILAQIIGSNRVSVSRIISELVQAKLISIQKKKIVVHSPILLSQSILNR